MDELTIEALFKIAMKQELEAQAFYHDAARRVTDAAAAGIFAELSREEKGHYELLDKFAKDPATRMKIAAPQADWKVAESEALPALSTDMKPKDAIALAMKKEQQAVEFYHALAKRATDEDLSNTLQSLANMELGHKYRLETIFVDIGYPEVF